MNVRIEHLKPSKCQDDFKKRVQEINAKKAESKKTGVRLTKDQLKRQPATPRLAHKVNITEQKPEFLTPLPYEFIA